MEAKEDELDDVMQKALILAKKLGKKEGNMEAKENVKKILLDRYGTYGLSKEPRYPETIEEMQKTMEIIFKAGRESRQDEIAQLNSIMNSKLKLEREYAVAERKAGIREVVEWVEENCIGVDTSTDDPEDYIGIQSMKWQALKKEKGINE